MSNVRQSVWSSESRCILRRVGRDNSNLRACEWTWKKFLASKCSREKCVYWGFVASERTLKAHIYCRVNCFFLLQNWRFWIASGTRLWYEQFEKKKKKHADLHTDNIKNQDLSIFTICIIFTFFPVHDYYTVCIYKDPSWQVCIPILKLYNLCFNCKLSNISNL